MKRKTKTFFGQTYMRNKAETVSMPIDTVGDAFYDIRLNRTVAVFFSQIQFI